MMRLFTLNETIKQNRGFTLLEIIIVILLISVMSLLVAPRISNFFGSKRANFVILTTMIAKTFDDSFINDRLNFLVLHLYEPFEEVDEKNQDVLMHENGISVVNIDENGKFIETKNKLLKYRAFPDSFRIEEVVLSTGEKISRGNVLIPFYPQGYSDNVILHILVNDEEYWSVRIYKMRKEADILPEFIEFEDNTI